MAKTRLWLDFPDEESALDFMDTLNLGMTKRDEHMAAFEPDILDSKSEVHAYIVKRCTDRADQFRLRREEPDYTGICAKCGEMKMLMGSVCGRCFTGTIRAENT